MLLKGMLPHLQASEQLEALQALEPDAMDLVSLLPFLKPMSPAGYEKALDEAYNGNNPDVLRRTLCFATSGETSLSDGARFYISECFKHPESIVRILAMLIAWTLHDSKLAEQLASSGWSVTSADGAESYYGSAVLAESCTSVTSTEILKRIDLDFHGNIAHRLKGVLSMHLDLRFIAQFRTRSANPST